MMSKLKKEIYSQPWVYLLLSLLLIAAFFVRVYRLNDLLGFYYDQGRDALVIWQFWHEGKFFLIGPITGIEGIYRGPWYYWLIAPFYLLGNGDPVWPAVFLGFTSVAAIAILYYLAVRVAGKWAGLLAVIIASFSYYLVLASRWLSNPTPMLFISMVLILTMFWVMEGKKWAWVFVSFMLGMAMQFGSAAEIFYFPAILTFAIWQRKNLPNKKILAFCSFILFITFAPQIIFDLRHEGVLSIAIKKFLVDEGSFKASFWEIIKNRAALYYQIFFSKLFPTSGLFWTPFATLGLVSLILNIKNLFANKWFLTIFLVFIWPLIGMLFFQGNHGNVYDYYFTGYYLVFVLIFSVLISVLVKRTGGLIVVFLLLILFLQDNLTLVKSYLVAGVDGPTHISLGNELQSVRWVITDTKKQDFNVDVYVPPVISYSYDYLFLWQTTKSCGRNLCGMVLDRQVPLLYTLYEVDPPHPERLDAWLKRQKGIGVVDKSEKFGGITVEQRHRIEQDNKIIR